MSCADEANAGVDAGDADAAADGGAPAIEGEGQSCVRDADCPAPLSCRVADRFLDATGAESHVSVCVRACDPQAPSCRSREVCASPIDDDSQALCFDITEGLFQACGAANTSFCGPTIYRCLALSSDDVTRGICVQPCALPGSTQITAPCPSGTDCRDQIDDPEYGVCLETVSLGETCAFAQGTVCEQGALCIVINDAARCYQDCSSGGACDDAKRCNALADNRGSYCN